MNIPDTFTPEEKEGVLIALDRIHNLFHYFLVSGLDGHDGLMKAILRGALFMLEEGVEKCKTPEGEAAVALLLLEEFREDQRK